MSRVKPGDVIRVRLPWSEVCMHLRVAEQVRNVRVLDGGAQILNEDGTPYSFPVTHAEAGIFTDANGLYVQKEEVCPSPQTPPLTGGATSSPAAPREAR